MSMEELLARREWLAKHETELLAGKAIPPKRIDGPVGEFAATPPKGSKYLREIKSGVMVDVYDVLQAWGVTNPALQHLIKKALQTGQRGHKSREEDLQDIVASAIRARELG